MDVFGGAPRFLAYPRPVIVQSGTDAVLKCQIGGDPRPAVIWERNNEKIDPQGRYRVFEDGNVYNLIISAVTIEDSGQYICKAKNCIGETYAAATLKVEGEAQEMELREENKPRFLIKPLSTRVGRGEDAVFSCKLWGNPKPEIVWEKDGRKLNDIFETTHFNVGCQDGGWFQLKIFKTRAPDGGVYTCKARNEFGEALAGAVLLVDAGPGHEEEGNRNGYTNGHWKVHQGKTRSGKQVLNRLKDETITKSTKVKMFAVTEGKHAKFRCFVTGKPKPEIIWRKDGRLILSGRRYLLYEDREGYFTLKVLYCKQKDNGVYVCAASNTAGQTLSAVHLSVKEPPVRFKQPLIDLEVWERDLAVLECEVPEDSVPITWYLEDRRLQPGAKYGMEEWGTKRRLTIRDIGIDDDGIYLCEMPDGGRSIAEVAVKGTIMRKLPRKVDVLEGENAAFCVEVEKEEMDIHWYKDGIELRETHQTILKSFGRTHILVFVNTMPEDSGLVTFLVGRSKTSSQLRVKAARHSPPSCPVGVQMNTERANAALLSWVPAPDSRKNPPSGYVLERQEVGTGSQEWVQCLTTDSATSVEILGDSVPCEADYRFRICSVNKYGKSNNVEFPKTVHLVPVARIQAPLQDALVPEGQDAAFSIELSASVIGTWFLNGTQLQEDERYSMRRSRTHQSLRIRGVRDTDNGAEITFIAYGIRDSAALYIQAPLVKFSPLSEMDRNKFVEVGNPIVLYCELSDPTAPVHWYKNGVELQTIEGLHIQSEGTMRRIVIQSAEFSHSGVYCCDAIDDVIRFNVEVEAPPVRFAGIPDAERNKTIQTGFPIVLQCEVSDSSAQVHWYKDGSKLLPQNGIDIIADSLVRKLVVHSAEVAHSGLFCCRTKGDTITFSVDIKASPLKFSAVPEDMRTKDIEAGCPVVLQCVVSDPGACVYWYKEEMQLTADSGLEMLSDGNARTLIIQSAELHHSGLYRCTTQDDAIEFQVEIKVPPPTYVLNPEEMTKSVDKSFPIVRQFEISDPIAKACWYKDGTQIYPKRKGDSISQSNHTSPPQSQCMSGDSRNDCDRSDEAQINENIKAGYCHFCDEIGELADASAQYRVDIKVASPRLSSDQERNRSTTEEAYCVQDIQMSSKCNSGICAAKDGDALDDLTGPFSTPCSAYDFMNDYTSAELEIYGSQQKITPQSLLQCPSVMKSATEHESRRLVNMPTKPQGEEFVYSKELRDVQSEELHYSLETAGKRDECCSCMSSPNNSDESTLQKRRPHSEEAQSTLKMQSAQSQQWEPQQTSASISTHYTNISELSVFQPEKMCGSSNFETSLSMEKFDSLLGISVLSEGQSGSKHMSEDSLDHSQTERLVPMSPYEMLEFVSDQTENIDRHLQKSTAFSEKLFDHSNVATLQQKDKSKTEEVDTFHVEHYNVVPSIKVDGLHHTRQTPSNRSQLLCKSRQEATVHSECHHLMKTAKDQEERMVNCAERSSKHLTDLFHTKDVSTLQSEEIYLSRMCDSHWGDTVTTNKVAVKASPSPVGITVLCEAKRTKSVEVGQPIVLQCELSDPDTQASWFKDGIRLHDEAWLKLLEDGSMRTLAIQAAMISHAGVYSCKTTNDAVQFHVDVKAPPPTFGAIPEAEQKITVTAGSPIALQCELSDPSGQVCWYKDGTKLFSESGVDIQSLGNLRSLVVPSAEQAHTGVYRCESKDDDVHFTVEVKAPSVKFLEVQENARKTSVQEGHPLVLSCELSYDPSTTVSWSKDGVKVLPEKNMEMQSDGLTRTFFIPSAQKIHSGVYECSTSDDTITFHVSIKGQIPQIMPILPSEKHKVVGFGCPIILQCEVSDPAAQVSWCKDGTELFSKTGFDMKRHGRLRKLMIHSAKACDSGIYNCRLLDDTVTYHVDVEAAPVTFSALPDITRNTFVEAGCQVKMQCKVSEPPAQVYWHKDGDPLPPTSDYGVQTKEKVRALVIEPAEGKLSGLYSCEATNDHLEIKMDIAAPPVTFADIQEKDLFQSVVEQEQLTLSCEVSRADGVVHWYKDGAEIQTSNNVTLQAESIKRSLTINSARISDTGTYTCRAGDSILSFKVNVREPPVMIVYPKEDVHLDRHVPEEIILSCELSRVNGVASWFKDGQKLQESENIKLKVEGPYRRLKILSSRVEDSGEYVCDANDDSIFFHLSITEPPVQILSPSQSQMELCQQTSERMVLSCEISRPNAVVRWYRDGLEVEENENLLLEVDGVYRRLIIPETTVKDSAEYVCDTGDDSMTYFVNIAEPPVRFIRPRKTASKVEKMRGETLILDCEVSRSNAKVTWKKNGEEVEDSRNITIFDDGVLRQLTIHSLTMEDAGQYICDAKDDVMDFNVKVQELPVKIVGKTDAKTEKQFLVSDDIILVCELSRANATAHWYKDKQLIDETERYCCEEQGVFRSLVVLNAGVEDSGEYTCDVVDDNMTFYITVKEPPVQIIGNSGIPEHHILVTGDDLVLECEVSRPNAIVNWLQNGKVLTASDRVKIDSHKVLRKLVVFKLQPSDSGEYICNATDDKLTTVVEVQDPPAKFLNKTSKNNITAHENESATMCAFVSKEQAKVRWLKDGQLLNENNIHISSEGNTHKLTINPLRLSDSGDYVCDINTDEMSFSLTVKGEMKVKFIKQLEDVVFLKAGSLTLQCEVNKPKADVQWLKDGKEISPSRKYTIRAQGRERSLSIQQLLEEDAGEYSCESTDDKTSATVTVKTPRVVEFIAELRDVTIREGEDAVFKCVVSPADTKLVWNLTGKQVALNERTVISRNGLCHMLCISNCIVSDSCRVTADAEGLVSEAELQVQEQQVLFSKKMTPVVAEEYSEATLEVELNLDSGEVQWVRQGVLIHPCAKYSLKNKGQKRSLTIHKLAVSDRGTYSCESLHDRTQAQLTVQPRKIAIKKGLVDIKTTERETASFEVELSHPNVPGTWVRNGIQLKPTNHFRMSAKGQVHSLTIYNLSVEDTGTFVFCVENLKTSARLVVKEPPVTIFRKLQSQKFPDGSVVSIECELSRHNIDVKWIKDGVEVKPNKDLRIYAMGRKRFLQIMRCHVTDSGLYTCDAGDASTSCTVEVYERELVVLQGLEDLDIQEDQNAVFVCEVSVEDVPGEWFKNGEQINPTSTIKIRQEGTKHFLLMCNVRAEDSGEIMFVARNAESVAHLKVKELPVSIVKPLQDKTVLEKSRVVLDCAVSNPRCSIRWYKGSNVILPSEHFEISSEGCYRKLIIQQVVLDDEGQYSVQVGEYTCSATLTVEAQSLMLVRELGDVEVVAPGEACFECEVSVPVLKSPIWSLNGEALQPSSHVRMEKMGTVHRLTLRLTSPDMSGRVEFTSGKAKSRAQLQVMSGP
ncbi:obscurin isoform X4 [Oryzias latipes]|uniref:obscurin isoform X4 n=1 Tax=Oryzias latipes TaxID=8090 RepID=UPI0009DA0A3A|nr:obscurin isoform X4 [Oryzias latipes]